MARADLSFDVPAMFFGVFLTIVGLLAGAIASISGFGIGSLLTPALALRAGTKLAVAAVAVPHLVGTVQRFWLLRRHVDRRVLGGFGLASAAGGLAGALAHVRIGSEALTGVFGLLLLMAGMSELTGWMRKVRWERGSAWVAGALSGMFGGLVGNQGGIRSAAMLGFDIPKEAFVATATAIALFVDAARLPVYVAVEGAGMAALWPWLVLASAAVVAGTALGARFLVLVSQQMFRRSVALLLLGLGMVMLGRAVL